MNSSYKHPCIGCGACCASYRVSFYWREAEASDTETPVLPETFDELAGSFRCMKGTSDKHHPKCISLLGKIGEDAHCGQYESRPSPCRNFIASYESGQRNIRCDEARMRHGLKPLTPKDWIDPNSPPNPNSPLEPAV